MDLAFLVVGVIIMSLLFSGCGTSPSARFYTLTPLISQTQVAVSIETGSTTPVSIGPVEIPEYLDRLEIVTRVEQNQLILSEFNLWGGSLKEDVNRVLTENISYILAKDGIKVATWRTGIAEVYRVPVMIGRFDGSAKDGIVLKARWAVLEKEGKAFEQLRESSVTVPVQGGDYGAVVAAMSDALGMLSREIGEGIRSVVGK